MVVDSGSAKGNANGDASKVQGRVLDEKQEAVFVVPFLNDWKMVICNDGSRFFSDPTGERQQKLDDSQSAELLEYIDKDKLVLLIGFARGYMSNTLSSDSVYDQVIEEIEFMRQDLQMDSNNDSEQVSESENEQAGLESEEVVDEQNDQLINTLNDLAEDEDVDTTDNTRQFTRLFDTYNLDKFSTWKREMKKVENDPTFFLIKNDQLREELFEKWCCGEYPDNNDEVSASEGTDEEGEEELEPTKYHYLSHIVNKSEINDNTIYEDIKNNQKALFKELRIKDFVKSKKEQQQFVSRLLFFYKRFTLEQRKELFRKEVNKHSQTLQKQMETNRDDAEKYLNAEWFAKTLQSDDAFAVETALLQLEQLIDIHGELKQLQEKSEYYVLGIKDKTIELFNILRTLFYRE